LLRDFLGTSSSARDAGRVLVGAGDIAECYEGTPPPLRDARGLARQSPAARTARLLDLFPGTVITIGDNAYKFGTPFDFEACYDPTWGREKRRTKPAAGNHEYMTPGAAGHFLYFGARSAPPLGYYSYSRAGWHIVVLNSTPQVYLCWAPELQEIGADPANIPPQFQPGIGPPANVGETAGRLCVGDAAQQAWLVADLTEHMGYECTLVYFHHPRFSSGKHGSHFQMQRIWDILYAYGVDVVLSAHDHNYERFKPQNPSGQFDPNFGIREFVVGTGGAHLRQPGPPIANSEKLFGDPNNPNHFGVIAMGLLEDEYRWVWLGVDHAILDSSQNVPLSERQCHGPPQMPPQLPFTIGQ
jgi:hypothetical protein